MLLLLSSSASSFIVISGGGSSGGAGGGGSSSSRSSIARNARLFPAPHEKGNIMITTAYSIYSYKFDTDSEYDDYIYGCYD